MSLCLRSASLLLLSLQMLVFYSPFWALPKLSTVILDWMQYSIAGRSALTS